MILRELNNDCFLERQFYHYLLANYKGNLNKKNHMSYAKWLAIESQGSRTTCYYCLGTEDVSSQQVVV